MRHFNFSNDYYIEFKGNKSFLIGADIHYFRIDPEHWRDRIQKAIDMGCNAISIYIPWDVHEVEDNSFDFDGTTHPRRNLIGFLELAKEFDIAVIAKPGPYVYSELPAQGLPEWFISAYPECYAKIWNGKDFVPMMEGNCHCVSYLHPVYLKFAQRWLSKVLSVIKPYQRSQNGTIEAVQICNEISGVHIWHAGYDANPETMGIGKEDGLYAEFFKEKYKSVEFANKAHKAKYKSFDEIAVPLLGKYADLEKNKNLACDYAEFYYNFYIPKYVEWLVEQFRKYGISEQLITNIAFPEMVVQMSESIKQNKDLLAGIDLYYTFVNNKQLGPANLSYCCEYGPQILNQITSKVPISFEFQAGAPDELEYELYSPHVYIWALWSFIGGYKGINLYVLAGGKNLPRVGKEGTTYDYQAPIDTNGNLRETYFGFKSAFDSVLNMQWLADSQRMFDVAVGVSHIHPFRDNPTRLLFEYFFRTGYSAQAVLIDNLQLDFSMPLWVASEKVMSRENQEKLYSFVLTGGTLIISGQLPSEDTNHLPCNILSEGLGVVQIEHTPSVILIDGMEAIMSAGYIFESDIWDEVISRRADGKTAIAIKKVGNGTAVFLPFEVKFSTKVQLELFKKVLEAAGVNQISTFSKIRVIALRDNIGKLHWCALNYTPETIYEKAEISGVEIELNMKPFSIETGVL